MTKYIIIGSTFMDGEQVDVYSVLNIFGYFQILTYDYFDNFWIFYIF